VPKAYAKTSSRKDRQTACDLVKQLFRASASHHVVRKFIQASQVIATFRLRRWLWRDIAVTWRQWSSINQTFT